MRAHERLVRLLPPPLKAAAKLTRGAVDPLAVRAYRRRFPNGTRPIPPFSLRAQTGNPGVGTFLEGGLRNANDLIQALATLDAGLPDFDAVLDFGCGSGRVLPHVARTGRPGARFTGSDVNEAAIKWAREHHPTIEWEINGYRPPLSFDEDSFDLVYSISVFTHLDERLQFEWLDEIARVLRPGGVALISTHGFHAFEECRTGRVVSGSASCARRVSAHDALGEELFIYEPYDVNVWSARDFPGVTDSFGMTFHAPEYVERRWTKHFEVIRVLPRHLTGGDKRGWQDLHLLRRHPPD